MPVNPPQTLTRSSHALTIQTVGGETIGLINSWNPSQGRTITPIFEINAATSGDPLENVPGNMQSLTIQVNRYDLFTLRMEKAFGTVDMQLLSDQNTPFVVREVWLNPDQSIGEALVYEGCWFSSLGRTIQSTNDRIVNVSATMMYVRRRRIQ